MVVTTIDEALVLVQNNKLQNVTSLQEFVKDFVHALKNNDEFIVWSKLIKTQYKEISSVFSQESEFEQQSELDQQTESDLQSDFVPFFPKFIQISCTVPGCPSKFEHKRSYDRHMKQHHPNHEIDIDIDEIRGVCRLFKRGTDLECKKELPLRTIYDHLLKRHNIPKPQKNHILSGFYLKPRPTPVFVKKTKKTRIKGIKYLGKKHPKIKLFDSRKKAKVHKKKEKELSPSSESEENTDNDSVKSDTSNDIHPTKDENDTLPKMVEFVKRTKKSSLKGRKILEKKQPKIKLSEVSIKLENDLSLSSETDEFSDDDPLKSETLKDIYPTSDEKESFPAIGDKIIEETIGEKSKKNKQWNEIENNNYASIEDETPTNELITETESIEADSDFEVGDEDIFTANRMKNKKRRHINRKSGNIKIYELDLNKKFVEDMQHYLVSNNILATTKINSTVYKIMNELFYKQDSFLYYEVSNNENFSLENLRSFTSDEFHSLRHPRDWLVDTCGEDGCKGTERLKSHAALRKFLAYSVDKYDNSALFESKKKLIRDNLEFISKDVTNGRLFKKYKKLEENFNQECERAKRIVNPSLDHNIQNCVVKWNNSFQKEELDRDHQFIYQEAIQNKFITPTNLTKYSHYARMCLCLSDKSRQGAYKFKFQHYLDKLPQYYPKGYTDFEALPPDWDPNERPMDNPDAEASVWLITVPGTQSIIFVLSHIVPV